MTYIIATTIALAKPVGSHAKYHQVGTWEGRFPSMAALLEHLKATYGRCKRQPMYQDTRHGADKIGYVYCFKEPGTRTMLRQDWVTIVAIDETNPFRRSNV